jgi:hypothetical protein
MTNNDTPLTKADLIHYRDISVNGELKRVLRWAVRRIENLESDLHEVDAMARSIRRIVQDKDKN